MDIGTSLTITLQNHFGYDEAVTYRSKVIDRYHTEVIIDYPINKNEYIDLPIRTNSTVGIEYISKGSVFKFSAKVIRILESPIMSFVIEMPSEEKITRIQRREYVRINIDVDVAVHSKTNVFKPFTTVTRDISGGGTAIIVPDNITLTDGEIVELYLVLKSKYSDFHYIKTTAEMIRTTIYNDVRSASLRFHFEDERERQKVIKYCFDIQREKLKRQIL